VRAQRLPNLRVAEECSHGDQEIVEQRLDLVAVLAQQREILIQAVAVAELHSPPQPT
jgi:hypothetical protein